MVLAGQSNMLGTGTNVADLSTAEKATQTSVLFYRPYDTPPSWGGLTPPTEFPANFGPEISLGYHLVVSGTYALVAQVKLALGGTNLADSWDPDPNISNNQYDQLLARVGTALTALRAAYPNKDVFLAGFFWMQGEADGTDPNMAAAYATNLTNLIAHLRADLHAQWLPVFVGRIRNSTDYAGVVRQAQADVAANVANVRMVDTDALPMAPDGLHYTSAGTVTLGNDFADSYSAWYNYWQTSPHRIFFPMLAANP